MSNGESLGVVVVCGHAQGPWIDTDPLIVSSLVTTIMDLAVRHALLVRRRSLPRNLKTQLNERTL